MNYPSFVHERIQDKEIVYNCVGGPQFNTQVNQGISGIEQRNVVWSFPLGRWELGERTLRRSQWEALNAFIRARKGKAIGFRFQDWSDYKVYPLQGVVQPVARPATAPAGSATFGLQKKYTTDGGSSDLRNIALPVWSTFKLYLNGAQLPADAYTQNVDGTVTLPSQPIGELTWSGEFDVPVRFDVDNPRVQFMAMDTRSGEQIFKLYSLPIVEIRL